LDARVLLRLEGAALFGAAVALYVHADLSALAFLALFLVPDLAIAAYAFGRRAGAIAYNLAHLELWPLVLGTVGVVGEESVLVQVALIWLAHIGIDRALGYGLKYPHADFNDSHLSRV
jgi:hypothetical protein